MYLSKKKIQEALIRSAFDVKVHRITQVEHAHFDRDKYFSSYLVQYQAEKGSIVESLFLFYFERNGTIRADIST
jgi:hypothetical protein